MARQRLDFLALGEIILERAGNLVGEIQYDLFAALARDDEGILLKIEIVDVQADAFADADARPEKQRQHGQIALSRHIMKLLIL